MIEQKFLLVLRQICERLSDLDHPWAITGSLGLVIQGVSVEVHDIDIQTNGRGAKAIEDLFAEQIIRPVEYSESPKIRSHFGQMEINGCKVDIMGDIEKKSKDGWLQSPQLRRIIKYGQFENIMVPVLDLSYELNAYRLLNRITTAKAIAEVIGDQES
jgi:hypothetical protein